MAGRNGRPIIVVTGPDRGGTAAWRFTASLVRWAGGRPVRVTPARFSSPPEWDGLIVGGGADISPLRYGLSAVPLDQILDHARDELEWSFIDRCLEGERPMMGICRGAQLLNVHQGGTLHQELTDFYIDSPAIRSPLPRKLITVTPGSLLERIVGRARCRVNSLHRQAIDTLAPTLQVCARESNGVVQAVEHTQRAFAIGVQWHPEFLPYLPEQRALFVALVAAARAARTA